MLKFNRDVILKPLTQTIGFVEKKQTMPILSNVYLKKTGDILVIIASDMEIQATLHINGGVSGDDFAITLPAKKFQDVLKALPDTEISMELIEHKVIVKAGKTKFTLQSLPAEQYPLIEADNTYAVQLSLTQHDFRRLIGQVQYSMAVNDSRVFLNGMLMEFKNQQLHLVATDAHRLSFVNYSSELIPADCEISAIIPRKTTQELYRLLEDNEENIVIKVATNQVIFETQNKQLITKVIDGRYPDYHRVIPISNDKLCLINREQFLRAVQRVAVIGIDKLRTLTLELKPNLLTISCRNEEQEESRDELVVEYANELELRLNFNINYVMDVLNNSSEEYLQWAFFDNQRSVLVTIPNQIDFKYVIMPLRA
ncbi:MAG: hypothetical protein RLZZ293_39 [Pseudomonadota bacterium]|jgi:DNA polymerase-3 subunit beta